MIQEFFKINNPYYHYHTIDLILLFCFLKFEKYFTNMERIITPILKEKFHHYGYYYNLKTFDEQLLGQKLYCEKYYFFLNNNIKK